MAVPKILVAAATAAGLKQKDPDVARQHKRSAAFAALSACVLAMRGASMSYPQIGRALGERHHSTVFHRMRPLVLARAQSDPGFWPAHAAAVEYLRDHPEVVTGATAGATPATVEKCSTVEEMQPPQPAEAPKPKLGRMSLYWHRSGVLMVRAAPETLAHLEAQGLAGEAWR